MLQSLVRKDKTGAGQTRSYPAYRPNQQITSMGALLIALSGITWILAFGNCIGAPPSLRSYR